MVRRVSLNGITFNIANATRDDTDQRKTIDEDSERVELVPREKYRFGERLADIITFLRHYVDQGYCWICLQEVRNCWNPEATGEMTAIEIVNTIASALGMAVIAMPCNQDGKSSFWRVILYDSVRLMLTGCKSIWTGKDRDVPSGPQYGMNILRATFIVNDAGRFMHGQYIKDQGTRVHIYNCHAPMMERNDGSLGRMSYCRVLLDEITRRHARDGLPAIIVGDMNTLPEMYGPEQIALLRSVLKDHSHESGVVKTFHGYPYDTNPKTNLPYESNLDMALSHGFDDDWRFHVTSVDLVANPSGLDVGPGVQRREVPISDHFPQLVEITRI